MLVGCDSGALAAPAGRIGMIQMRHHFSRAAITGDPAEIMLAGFLAEAGIGSQRRHAVGGDAAGNRMRVGGVGLTRGQRLAAVPHAIRELHAIAAAIVEAPMGAVALYFETDRCVMPATGRNDASVCLKVESDGT